MIVQGDEHNILFSMKFGSAAITSSTPNLQGVKVKFGNIIKRWAPDSQDDTIGFDGGEGATNKWYIKLTQAQTLSMPQEVPAQIQINLNGDIFTSTVKLVCVHKSIIKELWQDD